MGMACNLLILAPSFEALKFEALEWKMYFFITTAFLTETKENPYLS